MTALAVCGCHELHEHEQGCDGNHFPHDACEAAIVEVWCQECERAATRTDGLCDPCRAGVPTAIRDPWLIGQWLRTVKRR